MQIHVCPVIVSYFLASPLMYNHHHPIFACIILHAHALLESQYQALLRFPWNTTI